MDIRILGADEVRARLEAMRRSIASAGDEDVIVGSNLVYAPGMEYGRHPGGRLARRAGGTFALTDALEAVKPAIVSVVAQAIERSTLSVALTKLGFDVEEWTKKYLQERLYSQPIPTTRKGKPRWSRTGALLNSYETVTGRLLGVRSVDSDFRSRYRG